jgi:Transposase DDE domain
MPSREDAPVVDLDQAVRIFQKLVPLQTLNDLQSPNSRTVYTPWIVSWLMVYQRLSGYVALADALPQLAHLGDDLLPDNKRVRERTLSANTGGFTRARQRLACEVAESAADQVSAALIARSSPSLGDRRVFLIDGSTLSLAPTNSLRQAFPPAKNQHGESHWPVLRLVTAHDLSSGGALRPEIGQMCGSKAVGEVELSAQLLGRLPTHSVVIGDRNFGIFAFAWQGLNAGHDLLARLTKSRFQAMVRKAKSVGPGEWELLWKPSSWERGKNPQWPAKAAVPVRLHEVRISEKLTLWLVTSLGESAAVLAELYRGRGHIETDLRDLKQTLRLEEIRGQSPEMVRKEIATATIAYNLVVLIRRLAAKRAEVEPRRLSFRRVWALVRGMLLHSAESADPAKVEQRIEQLLRMAGQCKLPSRPGRNYRREVIPKRRKFPQRPPKGNTKRPK